MYHIILIIIILKMVLNHDIYACTQTFDTIQGVSKN